MHLSDLCGSCQFFSSLLDIGPVPWKIWKLPSSFALRVPPRTQPTSREQQPTECGGGTGGMRHDLSVTNISDKQVLPCLALPHWGCEGRDTEITCTSSVSLKKPFQISTRFPPVLQGTLLWGGGTNTSPPIGLSFGALEHATLFNKYFKYGVSWRTWLVQQCPAKAKLWQVKCLTENCRNFCYTERKKKRKKKVIDLD